MSRKEPSANDVIRVGHVVAVYEERHTVSVKFEDRGDGIVTKELPVGSLLTLKNHAYALPDEGEHVVCAFYGNGLAEGVMLGSIYDLVNLPPHRDRDRYYLEFEDDAIFHYDRKERVMELKDSFGSAIRMHNGFIDLMPAAKVRIMRGGKT